MMSDDSGSEKRIKVTGIVDVEVADHTLTVVGTGGLVAVTVIDIREAVLYVYHPLSGWLKKVDMTEEQDDLPNGF